MRIAYITDETMPNDSASGQQIVHTLSALARAGADVDMIWPVPPSAVRRPLEVVRAELRAHFGAEAGFGLVPLPSALTRARVPIKTAHAVWSTVRALGGGYDLLYTRTVGPIVPALLTGRPLLFETYRPLTQQFPWSRGPLRRAARSPHFAGIITHSRYTRDAFVADGLPADKVETVYNGFDPSAFASRRSPAGARAALGLRERLTVVYAGRIAPVKRTDLLLDAAERTADVADWVLAGANDTAEASPFVERAARMPNVHVTGFLRGDQLTLAHQAADVLVIPPSADPLQRFGTTVLPIKLFSYVAAGRAIIAGDLPDARELLTDGESARLIRPDDPLALAGAVRELAGDEALRARLAEGARSRSESLTWDARATRILAFCERRLTEMRAKGGSGLAI